MRSPDLSPIEQEHVRCVLWHLRGRLGSWKVAAAALGYSDVALRHVVHGGLVTPTMMVRVARLADAPIDDLLAGRFQPPPLCPHCGCVVRAS